jgi:hypothetical protein
VADRRAPFPPSALSPVSPEIARAAAAAVSGKSWAASAVFLLPALVATAILDEAIRGVSAEGRRRVLSTGVFLIQLIAAAGVLAVHVRRARDRVEGAEAGIRLLARGWRACLGMTSALCGGFLVAWVALGGAIESLSEVSGSTGPLRIVPLALAASMAAAAAVLAALTAWLAAIRAIEGCATGPAAAILRGLWGQSRGRIVLHAAVSGLATWAVWMAMSHVVGAIYAGAGPAPPAHSVAAVLYDQALRTWLTWTPPLSVLGSCSVASYLLLRPLNGQPP